ncbi:MAG: hypothetical protein U9N31_09085 [Candidatus Marinimicrobia bacterium]|nr:hypothetical protein [Candidatus Neomarinimicrobiota bacterium]
MKRLFLILIFLLLNFLISQEFKNTLSGGYYGRGGNSDYQYYNIGFSTVANGDISLGDFTLKDSEFLFAVDKNNSTWQEQPYENDQNIILKFDLWANGKFSPFLIFETSFDDARGIKNRTNFGLGAKYRLIGDMLSISAAFLSEQEEIIGKNSVSLYAQYGSARDSLGVTAFEDHPNLKPVSSSRISIRPKLKLKSENIFYVSEYYYQPAGDDVLTNWLNTITVSTSAEWLDIVIKYNYKNDSQPAPKVFMKYDPKWESNNDIFKNPGKGTVNFDLTPDQAKDRGYGEYYIQSYKADDTTISIGINISF